MNRFAVVVTIAACLLTLGLAGTVSVEYPKRRTHPALQELVAERHAAVAAGDLELARSVELRIQDKLKELHPLQPSEPANIRLLPGSGKVPQSFDPDVLIDTCRILSTAADYELDGAMYAAGHRISDSTTWVYKSRDHGETWERICGFAADPRAPQEKTGLVVGEGESTFVYGFFIDPANNGDLWCVRFDTTGDMGWAVAVLAGPDTVTDFAVCRDYSGDDYWLYALAVNGLGELLAVNDYLLRSADYGMTWAVVDTLHGIETPYLAASAGTWMFLSRRAFPGVPGGVGLDANAYYMSPDSWDWFCGFYPDSSDSDNPVVAVSFEAEPESATIWLMCEHRRRNTRNRDIVYYWNRDITSLTWSDTVYLASDPDCQERFPDIRSYTIRGNRWMNASYISEDQSFRSVLRRHAHSATPSLWSDPMTLNFTSAGTGSGVRPKLCYTPGGPGTGGGAIFTGSGLMGMYWNAPWHTDIVEGSTRDRGRRTSQTICRGTFLLRGGAQAELLDITGGKVMDLQPGENDIRHVAPGVYFVRRPETEDGRPRTAVRKVVIQR